MPLSRILGKLYQHESIKRMKNLLRPAKHALFGKRGIYQVCEEVARLEGGVRKVNVVFDVGAATGEYAVHFAKTFPEAHIYCFEPLPDSFRKLERRIQPYQGRVHAFPYGLYRNDEMKDFYVAAYRDASSLFNRNLPGSEIRKVRFRTLDDFVRENAIQKIDFMKIDVEGAELDVIKGGEKSFRHLIDNVFIEIQPSFKGFYSPDHKDLFSALYEHGFGFGGVMEDFFFSKLLPGRKKS